MNTDDFEKQLGRQSLRQPPTAWREEILQAALANLPPTVERLPAFFKLATWWRELILPARAVWGALAAVWIVIAAVSFATRDTAPVVAKAAPPTRAVERALQAQQQLRAELVGWSEPLDADKPKNDLVSPRSERRIECAAV